MRKLLSGTIAACALAATLVHGATIKVADSTVQFDFEEKVDAYGITVSDEPRPRSERLDGRFWFAAADQCAVDQAQGVSSAIRLA